MGENGMPVHAGHRKRMLEKVVANAESLYDHELLEILLYSALPRINTNEIAHRLLNAFGSLAEVFKAEYEQLLSIEGIGPSAAAYLRSVAICYNRMEVSENLHLPDAKNLKEISSFFQKRFHGLTKEVVELYTADAKERLSFAGRFSSELQNKVTLEPDTVNKILVSKRPYCVIVVHNHLTDSFMPSAEDDDFTAQMQVLCVMNNVKLYDHLIVSPAGMYSYFRAGKLDEIKRIYNLNTIFKKR